MRILEMTPERISRCMLELDFRNIVPLDAHQRRRWKRLDDCSLRAYAASRIKCEGIMSKGELFRADSGLYYALLKRKLLNGIGLSWKQRDWAAMSDGEMVAFAKASIEKREIDGSAELVKADKRLFQALKRRNLLDEVGIPDTHRKYRNWRETGRDKLVAVAKRFIEELGIAGRSELYKECSGLYQILRKRNLLDEVGLTDSHSEHRDWAGMGTDELIAHAKGFIEKKRISGRTELERLDSGLYSALGRRKLLDVAFSDAETSKHGDAVRGVVEALESFGDDS